MPVIIKIYTEKLISGVLCSSDFREVKNGINSTVSKLKKQNVPDEKVLALVNDTLNELRTLNQSKLSYDQHANIITAKVHLKELQMQLMDDIN